MAKLIEFFSKSKQGEQYCGDRFLFIPSQSSTLYVMIDGVGHGQDASIAADKACKSILFAPDKPLCDIAASCEKSLASTRGVAISIVRQQSKKKLIEYISVGNIEAYIVFDDRVIRLNKKPGILGARKRQFKADYQTVSKHASLLMFTDGVDKITPSLTKHFVKMRPHHLVKLLSDRWTGQDDVCIFCKELNND